ncbi:MAG: PC4/YdbC family ssDNA-binding protein [Caulobacteraceae bacterium]
MVIATLPKNSRERVRVALDEYQGHRLIDVRVVAQLTESSNAWFPTKRGVSLAIAHLPVLARALAAAEAQARELGLIGGDA